MISSSTTAPAEFEMRIETGDHLRIRIRSYRTGEDFKATVDNVDPGGVISRARGASRVEAEALAVSQAYAVMGIRR